MTSDSIEKLAAQVLDAARAANVTLGCAESCTGGLVAAALTEIPGSSDVFKGGIVSYWVEIKQAILGVDAAILDEHGVVSCECAEAMAQGACTALGCDYAVATTGIAGPGGEEPGKPVGTVCYAVAGPNGTTTLITCEGSTRHEVRELAVLHALELLYEAIGA